MSMARPAVSLNDLADGSRWIEIHLVRHERSAAVNTGLVAPVPQVVSHVILAPPDTAQLLVSVSLVVSDVGRSLVPFSHGV